MNVTNLRSVRRSAVLAAALALLAPPSSAMDLVAVRATVGLPRTSLIAGGAFAWRNVSIIAEGEFLDAELRVARCVALPSTAALSGEAANPTCAGSSDSGGVGGLGHQLALTFKVPQWYDGAPLVDLTLRNWHAATLGAGPLRERHSGSVAGLTVTQPLGPFDALLGYTVPVSSSQTDGIWHSTYAGVAWRPTRGTVLEFVADRGVEAGTGAIDRTITLKASRNLSARGVRLAAWGTHSLDDPSDRLRIGAGLEFTF